MPAAACRGGGCPVFLLSCCLCSQPSLALDPSPSASWAPQEAPACCAFLACVAGHLVCAPAAHPHRGRILPLCLWEL